MEEAVESSPPPKKRSRTSECDHEFVFDAFLKSVSDKKKFKVTLQPSAEARRSPRHRSVSDLIRDAGFSRSGLAKLKTFFQSLSDEIENAREEMGEESD